MNKLAFIFKMFYIYRIINKINGHDYIGKKLIDKNKDPLLDGYYGSGTLIRKAIEKYGKDNFEKEILDSNIITEEEAILIEIKRIYEYKNKGLAYYNISPGGEGFLNREISISLKDKEYFQLYRKIISDKVKKDWENMSMEKRLLRNSHMEDGWRKKEDLDNWCNRRSLIQKEVMSRLTNEEKKEINRKRSQTLKEGNLKRIKVKKGERVFKIKDPRGNILIVKGLMKWCKSAFPKRPQSASACLLGSTKRYKGYELIEEVTSKNLYKENI